MPTVKVGPAAPNFLIGLTDVGYEIGHHCSTSTGSVRLDFRQGDVHLTPTITCALARDNESGLEAELVDLVSHRHNAGQRADLINTLAHEVGVRPYLRPDMVWSIGTGMDGCLHVADTTLHRQELAEVATFLPPTRETAVHWTKVEAVRFAGTCPSKLGAFFDSVAQAGQPAAATAVRNELTHLGISS